MASDTLTQTIVSFTTAVLGSGGLGAVIMWYVNSRGLKSDTHTQAQKNVFEAFEELAKTQQARIDQLVKQLDHSVEDRAKIWADRDALWRQMLAEKEHSRQQDAALLDCERNTVKQNSIIANLNLRIRQLENAREQGLWTPLNPDEFDNTEDG